MLKKIAIAFLILAYPALVVVGNFYPFAGGSAMQQAFARGTFPEVNQSYSFTDSTTGKVWNLKVLVIGPTYTVPAEYTSCSPVPLRCTDNVNPPADCSVGTDSSKCDSAGDRMDYITPSHRARAAEYAATGQILAPTVTYTRASLWNRIQSMALAVGDAVGGPAGQGEAIDMQQLPDGSWMIDFDGPSGFSSVVAAPGEAT